jgi:hypothetical protein
MPQYASTVILGHLPHAPTLGLSHASTVVLGTFGVALIAVTLLWPLTRNFVHAIVIAAYLLFAMITGVSFNFEKGFWVRLKYSGWVGVWFQRNQGWWPAKVLTAFIPYATPSLLGLLVARAYERHWSSRDVLIVALVIAFSCLLLWGNWWYLFTFVFTAALIGVVIHFAHGPAQRGAVVFLAWLLLLGGLRLTISEAGYTHPDRTTFPGILADLTDIPAFVWMVLYVLIAIASLIEGAHLIVRHEGVSPAPRTSLSCLLAPTDRSFTRGKSSSDCVPTPRSASHASKFSKSSVPKPTASAWHAGKPSKSHTGPSSSHVPKPSTSSPCLTFTAASKAGSSECLKRSVKP